MEWRARARRIIESVPELSRKKGILTPEEVRILESVRSAMETTGRHTNGDERLNVVDMVYWQKSCTLRGAALQLRYSYDTVQEWHAEFISLVDAYYRILGRNDRGQVEAPPLNK